MEKAWEQILLPRIGQNNICLQNTRAAIYLLSWKKWEINAYFTWSANTNSFISNFQDSFFSPLTPSKQKAREIFLAYLISWPEGRNSLFQNFWPPKSCYFAWNETVNKNCETSPVTGGFRCVLGALVGVGLQRKTEKPSFTLLGWKTSPTSQKLLKNYLLA